MVFSESGLREHLKQYLAHVHGVIKVQKAVLYGSYAYGTAGEDSDIDLVVLSDDFKGMPKLERHQQLGWLAWKAETGYIQPLGFTLEEFEAASPASFLGEVRERGIVVYEAEKEVV